MNLEDESLYNEINTGESIGIFQMNGNTAKRLVEEIKPQNFSELNACNAMARPGPIENAPLYIDGKNGIPSQYPKQIQEVLSSTYSVPVFQEQIMEIFHKIGGFTLEEADEVRNLMKKLGKAEKDPEDLKKWNRIVKKFSKSAVANGIKETDIDKITNDLIAFSSYSFNLSHSTSYSYVAVMTLYLSVYFRKYFYSSVLKYEVDRDKQLSEIFQTIKNHEINVLPPDINLSGARIKPLKDNTILFGLNEVKYVGEKPAQHIIDNRPYASLFDFIIKAVYESKGGVNSRAISSLIKVGAFDSLISGNRKLYLQVFELFWQNKKSTKIVEKLKFLWDKIELHMKTLPMFNTTTQDDLRKFEKEIYGVSLFTSLFTDKRKEMIEVMLKRNLIKRDFDELSNISSKIPVELDSVRTIVDRNGNRMAFITISDFKGLKITAPVFASYWQHIGEYFIPEKMYLMNLYKDDNDSILFGQKAFTFNEYQIRRMIKAIL